MNTIELVHTDKDIYCQESKELTTIMYVNRQDDTPLVRLPSDTIAINIEISINRNRPETLLLDELVSQFQRLWQFNNYETTIEGGQIRAECNYLKKRKKTAPIVASRVSHIDLEIEMFTEADTIDYKTIYDQLNAVYTALYLDKVISDPYLFCPNLRAKLGDLLTLPTIPKVKVSVPRIKPTTPAPKLGRMRHAQSYQIKKATRFDKNGTKTPTKSTAELISIEKQRYLKLLDKLKVSEEDKQETGLELKVLYEEYQRKYSLAKFLRNPNTFLKNCRKCGQTPNFLAFELPRKPRVLNSVFDK